MISRPIFIVGGIRSGTTILYNLMAIHPDVCWFSNHTNRHPGVEGWAVVSRLLDWPVVGNRLRRTIASYRHDPSRLELRPLPHEGDDIYHAHCGFGGTRDGVETVMTEQMEARFTRAVEAHLRWTSKARFLSKQTANNRRLALIDQMFPDALYVHVIRDGRAVASSTLRMPWWSDTHIWWLGKTAAQWAADGGEPIELAALYWDRTVKEIRRVRETVGKRYKEVRYERLVEDTAGTLDEILSFCGLRESPVVRRLIPVSLPDMNTKWREHLTISQQNVLETSIGPLLAELGYA